MEITRCGYRCDLCKALGDNIVEKDQRAQMSDQWKKYYELSVEPVEIYCDGCRCHKEQAVHIDEACPVKSCVMSKKLHSCADCDDWPCATFNLRKGLSFEEAKEHAGQAFEAEVYHEYLSAFDNYTRILALRSGTDK